MSAKAQLVLLLSIVPTFVLDLCQSPGRPQSEAEPHLHLAEQYLGRNRPDLAIQELQKVVDLDPNNMEAHGNLGVLLFFRGDYSSGVAPQLRTAVQDNPSLWKIWTLLGHAESHLGDASASRADLEAASPNLSEGKIKTEVGEALIQNYTATGELEKTANISSALLASKPTDTKMLCTETLEPGQS